MDLCYVLRGETKTNALAVRASLIEVNSSAYAIVVCYILIKIHK